MNFVRFFIAAMVVFFLGQDFAFAQSSMDIARKQANKDSGKRVYCEDHFAFSRDEQIRSQCIEALNRVGKVLKEFKIKGDPKLNYFEEIFLVRDALCGKCSKDVRNTNAEGKILLGVSDDENTIRQTVQNLTNDFRKLNALRKKLQFSKPDSDFVYISCDSKKITFENCIWGLNSLKVALKDPVLKSDLAEVIGGITLTDQYQTPSAYEFLYVRYYLKIQPMRDQLRKGLEAIN